MNTLVIGLGSIGKRHFQNLKQFGHQVTGIDIQDSLNEVLDKKPDAVFICTPTRSHIDIALEVASRRIPYFIEKPLSHSLTGVDDLIELSTKVPNMVACNIRFHPAYALLSKLYDPTKRGVLQAVFGFQLSKWVGINAVGLGEDIALEAIHEVDYCDWVLKGLKDLSGFTGRRVASFSGIGWDGSVASISLDSLSPLYTRYCRLVYDDLVAIANMQSNVLEIVTPAGKTDYVCSKEDQYVEELKSFLDSLQRGEETANPVRRASSVLGLVLQTQDCGYNPSPENVKAVA